MPFLAVSFLVLRDMQCFDSGHFDSHELRDRNPDQIKLSPLELG